MNVPSCEDSEAEALRTDDEQHTNKLKSNKGFHYYLELKDITVHHSYCGLVKVHDSKWQKSTTFEKYKSSSGRDPIRITKSLVAANCHRFDLRWDIV